MGKLQKEQQELTGSEVFRTGAQKETAPEATDSINAPQIQRISINTSSTKESRKEEEKTDQIREGISEEIQTDQSASGESLQKSANKVYFERILEMPKTVGVTLSDSLLMTPTKSITAVVGLTEIDSNCEKSGCEQCAMAGKCAYSRN